MSGHTAPCYVCQAPVPVSKAQPWSLCAACHTPPQTVYDAAVRFAGAPCPSCGADQWPGRVCCDNGWRELHRDAMDEVRELRADVVRLRDAGAVLLRAVYASGIAYRDTEIAAALAAFARL